jgi:hypothetical protein
MGEPQRGYNPHWANSKKRAAAALFSFIPIEAITKQWSRAV